MKCRKLLFLSLFLGSIVLKNNGASLASFAALRVKSAKKVITGAARQVFFAQQARVHQSTLSRISVQQQEQSVKLSKNIFPFIYLSSVSFAISYGVTKAAIACFTSFSTANLKRLDQFQKAIGLSKKVTVDELLKNYNDLKKQSKTAENKVAIVSVSILILDYFVAHYQEGKKLLKSGALSLNELLDNVSEKDRKDFCQKAVKAPWFWDFQRKTYPYLLDSYVGNLKTIYAVMLCKEAVSLPKNPIAGFPEQAFQERKSVLAIYAQGKSDPVGLCGARFEYKGALGQANHLFW